MQNNENMEEMGKKECQEEIIAESEEAEAINNEESSEQEKLQEEIAELNQKLLRVSADFDNFRKRTRVEKEELAKYANSVLVTDLLSVLDNFQLALEIKDPNEEVKKFLSGMEMIHRQFMQILNQAGLAKIEAKGEIFDPNKHEAVMQIEDSDVEDNTIIEELRTGYTFKDKVIRPSMVKVAKNS